MTGRDTKGTKIGLVGHAGSAVTNGKITIGSVLWVSFSGMTQRGGHRHLRVKDDESIPIKILLQMLV